MIHNKMIHFAVLMFVLSILTSSQLIDNTVVTLTPIYDENFDSQIQSSLPVGTNIIRNLQTVVITTGNGTTLVNSSITKYAGLIVYQDFPVAWTIGEIFQIRGKLTTAAATNGTYVCFSFINTNNSALKYTFKTLVAVGTFQFVINVDTRSIKQSNYYVALYPTLSGSYYLKPIYQIQAPPATEPTTIAAPLTPTGCSLTLADNKLTLKWTEDSKTPIQKVTFTQGSKVVQYVLSNFQSSFDVVFKDFSSFTNGSVTVTIASAYSSTNGLSGRLSGYSVTPWSYTFTAGPHHFAESSVNLVLTQTIPWTAAVGATITIKGSATVILESSIMVQEPQNVINAYNISSSSTIAANTAFSKTITLSKAGVYILQVNADTGIAVLNRPIYVGGYLPLIPDFVDLTIPRDIATIAAAQPQTIDLLRSNLLTLINQKRGLWGKASLTLDTNLNNLAQAHSTDMITRNFFGHINPDGNGPTQRAKLAGLNYSVGQNLAYNADLTDGQNRLCRSPGHLANIVESAYTRVGLGIVKNSQGYLYITQNFAGPLVVAINSTTPILTATQIETFRVNLKNWLVANYPVVENSALTLAIQNYEKTIPTNVTVFNYIWNTAKFVTSSMSSYTFSSGYNATYTSGLTKGSSFVQPDTTFGKVGVGCYEAAFNGTYNGTIGTYIVYAK